MHGIEVVIEALVCALTTNYIYEKYNKKQKLKNVTKNKKIIIENEGYKKVIKKSVSHNSKLSSIKR